MTGCRWQGAIFDLDGTLLDSMPVWRDLGDAFLQRQGIAPAPDLAAALAPLSLRQAAVYLRQQYGLTQPPEQLVEQISAMLADCYRFSIPLKPGAAAAPPAPVIPPRRRIVLGIVVVVTGHVLTSGQKSGHTDCGPPRVS